MADPITTETPVEKPAKVRYFETRLDGLKIQLDDTNPDNMHDPANITYFTGKRYSKRWQGEAVKVQIFMVDKDTPKRAANLLETDSNVYEITPKQYEDLIADPETKALFSE